MDFVNSIKNALKGLTVNWFRSILTMLGIIIGVASVIILISIGEGAKKYISDQFSDMGTNIIIITPGKTETTGGPPMITETVNKLTIDDSVAIKKQCNLVESITPVNFASTYIKYENRSRNCFIIGSTNEIQQIRHLYVEIGSFLPPVEQMSEKHVCVLGRTVKEDLFGGANPLGKMVSIGGTKYRVIGIMKSKGMSLGLNLDDLAFIPVKASQELFNSDDVKEILISTRSMADIPAVERQSRAIIKKRHHNNEDFTVTNQAALLSAFQSILTVLTYAVSGIAGISLIVGGIGIMNIMLISIVERTREIGLRKAVGATKHDILNQFLIESATISGIGGILGITMGVSACLLTAFLVEDLPLKVSLWTVMLAFLFSVTVGIVSGLYPAWKAAKMDPVEAIRYE